MPMGHISEEDEIRELRLERFENICALAKTVPGYRLHMSLNGTFWQKIEEILSANYKEQE